MLARRVPFRHGGMGEVRATGLFVVTAATVAVLVAFVPHTARVSTDVVVGVNSTFSTIFALQRTYVRPAGAAPVYGIQSHRVRAAAGRTFAAFDSVRPVGAPGGNACLALVAVPAGPSARVQTARECVPLVAGWSRLKAIKLRVAAPGSIYAQILVSGNRDGFQAGALAPTPAAP